MKTYEGMDVELYSFLTSLLDGSDWLASGAGRFIPGKRGLGIYWIGGWLVPIASMDAVAQRKSLCPAGHRTPAVQPLV